VPYGNGLQNIDMETCSDGVPLALVKKTLKPDSELTRIGRPACKGRVDASLLHVLRLGKSQRWLRTGLAEEAVEEAFSWASSR
jgi:hypothetical protein